MGNLPQGALFEPLFRAVGGQPIYMRQLPSDNRLDTFLSRLNDVRRREADASLGPVRRLSRVLETISAFRQECGAKTEAPQEREFAAERLVGFMARLRAGLVACQNDGRLLNVWTIAGLKRNEVRTSAVLGWALDCNGSHGFRAAILDGLVELLRKRGQAKVLDDVILGQNYRLAIEHCALGERDNRVDLAIEGENCVMVIEVKIDAPEGPEQLLRYVQLAKNKAVALQKPNSVVLYLSEAWPVDKPAELVCLRWRDVARAISNTVTDAHKRSVSGALLLQFAAHIKNLH
ncbi:hypothetical protein E0H36_05250 [Rhizobium leguminosarum bv. viciae]|nr:hypothetical protein E0H36_05250 [Rhizobium leguminosarum bv. viciae]